MNKNYRLKRNKKIYNLVVEQFLKNRKKLSFEKLAIRVEFIANLALRNFCGILADNRLDEVLAEIGQSISLDQLYISECEKSDQSKILHIATCLYDVGGHTRVIKNWIEKEKEYDSYLFVTNQASELGEQHINFFTNTCKDIQFLNENETKLSSSLKLSQYITKNNINKIVLHQHGDDVIPTIALSTVRKYKNLFIIFYNHADHVFSLGVAIANLVIDFRKNGQHFSLGKRNATKSELLPYPLSKQVDYDRASIRRRLKLPEDKIVLLTIASSKKYKPIDDVNFFNFYSNYLKQNTHLVMFVIGPTEQEVLEWSKCKLPPNMKVVGEVIQPEEYYIVSDYFIEPFPWGTGLGACETCQYGAFPIFNYVDYSIYGASLADILSDTINLKWSTTIDGYKKIIDEEFSTGKLRSKYRTGLINFFKTCNTTDWINQLHYIINTNLDTSHYSIKSKEPSFLNDQNSFRFARYNYQPLPLIFHRLLNNLDIPISFLNKIKLLKLYLYTFFSQSIYSTKQLVKLIISKQ